MAALEAPPLSLSSINHSSPKFLPYPKKPPSLPSLKPHPFKICPLFSRSFSLHTNRSIARNYGFQLRSAVQETALGTGTEEAEEGNKGKKKVLVVNLPWSFSVVDIKNLFGQCGTVSDVEIIKQKDGRNRGFAFVTMASGEEAQAAVDKFNSHEVSGRIIKVEFAKRFKKPSPPPPPGTPPARETRHKLYVSNLAWKVRSSHLREFFSASFKPVSSRVVFDSPTGRSAGYGFVSFATREEAEAAILSLDRKELMGRPLRLKFSEVKADESGNKNQEEQTSEDQPEEE